MLTPMKERATSMLIRQKPKQTDAEQTASAPNAVPTDDAALRALAWLDRGQPDAEVVYDETVPKQTPQDLKHFERRRLVKTKRR
jgi:hypothetical protein